MALKNDELIQALDEAVGDAIDFNAEFGAEYIENLDYYEGRPFGNEEDGKSSAVTTDVRDVIESDMPSLARVFLGSGDICTFHALSVKPEAVEEAKQKTQYINWLIKDQPHSYRTLLGWLKESEIKAGVVKYFVEEEQKTRTVKYRGLSEIEAEALRESMEGENIESVEIVERIEGDDAATFDVEFMVTQKKRNVPKFTGVKLENFLITKGAASEDDAPLVGDVMIKTRSELQAMGVSMGDIKRIPKSGCSTINSNQINAIRFDDQGLPSDSPTRQYMLENVELMDLYCLLDYKLDGNVERRRILRSRIGDVIIKDEPFDHVPYAIISSILMPHKSIGKSRADLTKAKQLQKSTILRGALDNMYLSNNGMVVVNENNVNIDDFLVVQHGSIKRTSGIPSQDVMQLTINPMLGDAFQMLQYLDLARAQSTGSLMASQGLTSDRLHTETATRFNGIDSEGQAKIELVARSIAETGFRKLYDGMLWLVEHYQDAPCEIAVLGKELRVDPATWRYSHTLKTNVGLGAGDNEQIIDSLMALYNIQTQLKASGSALTDETKLYATLSRITTGLGLPMAGEFFNDPQQPDELLKAENEILRKAVEQLQQEIAAKQNPLAESEQIKAQAKLIEAKGRAGIEAAKLTEQARVHDDKMELEGAKLAADHDHFVKTLAARLTELEAKYERELSAENQSNEVDLTQVPTDTLLDELENGD